MPKRAQWVEKPPRGRRKQHEPLVLVLQNLLQAGPVEMPLVVLHYLRYGCLELLRVGTLGSYSGEALHR